MRMRFSLSNTLRCFYRTITIASLIFVVIRLFDFSEKINIANFNLIRWTGIAFSILIYGLSNLMLAFAWKDLLLHFGVLTEPKWAIKTYGMTQLAKYAPGNIFHLAGRQAIGMASGISGWSLAKSTAWELGLLSLSGVILGMQALPLLLPVVSMVFSTIFLASTVSIIAFAMGRFYGKLSVRTFCFASAGNGELPLLS